MYEFVDSIQKIFDERWIRKLAGKASAESFVFDDVAYKLVDAGR